VVVLQTRSRSPWASDRAADRGRPAAVGAHRIAFVIADYALEQALRAGLASHPGLAESDEEAASVVIADAPPPEGDFGGRRQVLVVGAGGGKRPDETAIESLDPSLILAAATVLASGYRIVPGHTPLEPVHLSTRERQVVALLVEGASNKHIARELDISVHTAKFHVTAVLEKLGARNRADAVAIALREGLVML
jgi:DNA-binding CsgD family transcriptional regulator